MQNKRARKSLVFSGLIGVGILFYLFTSLASKHETSGVILATASSSIPLPITPVPQRKAMSAPDPLRDPGSPRMQTLGFQAHQQQKTPVPITPAIIFRKINGVWVSLGIPVSASVVTGLPTSESPLTSNLTDKYLVDRMKSLRDGLTSLRETNATLEVTASSLQALPPAIPVTTAPITLAPPTPSPVPLTLVPIASVRITPAPPYVPSAVHNWHRNQRENEANEAAKLRRQQAKEANEALERDKEAKEAAKSAGPKLPWMPLKTAKKQGAKKLSPPYNKERLR